MDNTFIIAEVGPNHNGSIKLAEELINKLVSTDVDAIKFQLANPSYIYSKDAYKAEYQKKNDKEISPLKMSQNFQLTHSQHEHLSKKCNENGVEYMCTGFDIESLKFLNEDLNISRFKIPSGEIFSVDLLDYIKKFDKPIIMSTGMAKLSDIKNIISYLKTGMNKDITVLHCVSNYPAPLKDVNMQFMKSIENECSVQVGFSDHTINNLSSITAVSMGATIIEKHVTLDKNLPGPDHKSSSTIDEFDELVKQIRLVGQIKGSSEKVFSDEEIKIHLVAKKSIVSARELEPGHFIQRKDICFKRPGTGVSPMDLNLVVGKKVKIKIEADRVINLKYLND